nr:MAG TPA: hypothetical protein [Bacteriophage sp.]
MGKWESLMFIRLQKIHLKSNGEMGVSRQL